VSSEESDLGPWGFLPNVHPELSDCCPRVFYSFAPLFAPAQLFIDISHPRTAAHEFMSPNASSTRDNQSFHYIIRSGIAGGIAGCVAKTAVAPLDRVKILFQASNPDFQKYAGTWSGVFRAGAAIYKEAGIWGLLQGHSATLIRVFPYAAIKFIAYDQVHHILMPTRAEETNFRRFSAGAISGTISVFFTYPLEVIRVRMAYQTRRSTAGQPQCNGRPSFFRAISHIYNEGAVLVEPTTPVSPKRIFQRYPILKFYRGFTVTIAGMVPYAGTSFLAWGYLRARFLPPPAEGPGHKQSTPIADLGFGAVAGALSQTASYPFEIIRRKMQVGGLTKPDTWMSWRETIGEIWRKGGVRGFYVGLTIGYLKVVPMTAISFTVWQAGKNVLGV